MNSVRLLAVGVISIGAISAGAGVARATAVSFTASQWDLGGTFFPGYNFPQVDIVPWRSDSEANFYSVSSEIDHRYYGTAGYALFGTRFDFPNADTHDPAVGGVPANANIDPTMPHPNYPDIIDLPNFITNSQVLGKRIAGGWGYALLDDPRMQEGIRHWTFDGTNYPPANGMNGTGTVPFVKLGIIDGLDVFGNNPTVQDPSQPEGTSFISYRWGFQVGANVPKSFRIGVITDGLDSTVWTPTEVIMQQVSTAGGAPTVISSVTTGTLPTPASEGPDGRNRFVDMHFFDITDAQAGDQFAFGVRGQLGGGHSAGVSGFSFDILDPTVQVTPGDYNSDGIVNAADYTIWRDNLGSGFALNGRDPSNSGNVNDQDYAFWKSQFGTNGGAGAGSASASVPEPTSALLIIAASAFAMLARRSRATVAGAAKLICQFHSNHLQSFRESSVLYRFRAIVSARQRSGRPSPAAARCRIVGPAPGRSDYLAVRTRSRS